MGFKLLGLNIDIPFKSTLEGIGNGIKHLCRGEIGDAFKATLKGVANDVTGQIALAVMTGGTSLALTAGLTVATSTAITAGGIALGVADGVGLLDTKEEKLKKQHETMLARQTQQADQQRSAPPPQLPPQHVAAYAGGHQFPQQFVSAPHYPPFANHAGLQPPPQPPQFSVNWA